ncbi:uncharacterized protein [Argopecten irradians]|uniref:uncharacterized protein n=1 Tax=Argopecten irradians TaxID=31199 RepID=UPI003723EADC
MDLNANKKFRPSSGVREFMNLQRVQSDVFDIAVKPVSSPNCMKTCFIIGTAFVCVSILVAIAVAVTVSINSPEHRYSSLHGKEKSTTSYTTTITTTAMPTTLTTPGSSSADTTVQTTPEIVTTTQAPNNGTWNNWGAWTSCRATCGTGSHTRYRTYLRASPVATYLYRRICTDDNMFISSMSRLFTDLYHRYSERRLYGL